MTTYQQWTPQGLGIQGFGAQQSQPGHLLRLPGTQFLNPYAGAPPSVSPRVGGPSTGYAGAYGSGKGVQTARTGLSSAPWAQQPTGYANPFGIPTQGPAPTMSSPFAPITTLPQPGLPGVPTGPGRAGVTPNWPGQLMPTGYADPTLAAPGAWGNQNPSGLGGTSPRNMAPWQNQNPSSVPSQTPRNPGQWADTKSPVGRPLMGPSPRSPAPWGNDNPSSLTAPTPRNPAIAPPTMEPTAPWQNQNPSNLSAPSPRNGLAPPSMSSSSVPFWMQTGQSTPTYRTGGSAVGGVRG